MHNVTSEYRIEESIGHLASNASRAILRRINRELALQELPITTEQFSLLVHIWDRDGQPQRVHVEKLLKDKTTLARVFASLESQGLIRRDPGPNDAREKIVYLTPQGEVIMTRVTRVVQEILEIAQKGIEQRELEICRSVLRRFRLNLG